MTLLRMYPFPRIDQEVTWTPFTVSIDGIATEDSSIGERWDVNAELSVTAEARVPRQLVERFGLENAELALTATCVSTARGSRATSKLQLGIEDAVSVASVSLIGKEVADKVIVRAMIVAPHGNEAWLARRVVAERTVEIFLNSEAPGFPVAASSFAENSRPEAPWYLQVLATSAEDPLVHSVRLELNTDYKVVAEYIAGKDSGQVKKALEAAMIRILLQTVRRLVDQDNRRQDLDTLVVNYPDSIVAAAARISSDFLRMPLSRALEILRERPQELEALIDEATRQLEAVR